MYGIKSRMLSVGGAQNVPKVCEDLLGAPYVCEAERECFGDGQEVDWTPPGRMMRGATASQDIIQYFDIADSATPRAPRLIRSSITNMTGASFNCSSSNFQATATRLGERPL
ncbi:hypothetical protein FOZ63_012993 [Perkinsus olseni]|uniref:Uncharacterized protein n=1 Tax=Perkinsus olseni TaxID=32597 RepID=A0A7J6QCF9_PEROL|nr:hypothetical protein FOZ63_012993 [Perkinsus olseni]